MIYIRQNMKIVFIGDSITDVAFNRRMKRTIKGKNSYPLLIEKEFKKRGVKAEFYFKGIASNRSYHVYDRLTKDCVEKKPDLIVLFIGVNDAWEEFVPEQYPPKTRLLEPHFREILRRLRAELPDAQTIVMTPFLTSTIAEKQGFRIILERYCETEKSIAEEYGFREIVDLQSAFDRAEKSTEPKFLSVDSVHPTDLGHAVIAAEILKRLRF